MGELREQLQESTIVVGVLERTHFHPGLAGIGRRYEGLEVGGTAMKVQL